MKRKEISTTENTERTEVDAVASGHSVVNTEDLPDGFQMTELGPLPKEWRVVRLGEIARVKYGKAKPTNEHGNIPVIGSGGIYGWTTEAVVDFPTLIIGRKGAAGQVWLSESPSWPSDTTFYLEWKSYTTVDVQFIYGWFLLNPLSGEHAKTTIPSLQRPDLENFLIPLPPLPEQRAIAHVLRTVQRAKEATEGVIAALKELKKSLMQHLFTYGPIPVTEHERVALQESEIGPLPAHWRVVRLGEVATLFTRGIDPANAGAKRYIGLEHIEPGNIRIQHWGKADDVRSLKTAFQQGDVLYGKLRPYLDKAVLAEWDGICSTDILVIKAQSSLLPEFLAYLVHTSQFIDHAISTTTGVNHPRTSWKALQKFSIPLPPLDEQREIARMLQAVDAKIAAEQARRAALEELFKSLLHELMSGRLRLPNIVGRQRSRDSAPNADPLPELED